jgi:hypothetical protein
MNRSGQYVEFARFKTKAGITHEQFVLAEEAVRRGMLRSLPGYLSRELYRNDQGEWSVVLRFTDKASMDALLERLKEAPDESFKNFGAMIDRETMRVDFVWLQT